MKSEAPADQDDTTNSALTTFDLGTTIGASSQI
jgi:hypothetical protein